MEMMPYIDSPFKKPEIWQNGADCLFLDSDEATQEQLGFIARVKKYHELKSAELHNEPDSNLYEFRVNEPLIPYETELTIPKKFQHVDVDKILKAQTRVDELLAVLKKVHPWSALYYGLSATDVVKKLYLEWIPKYFGSDIEIQIITPMTRGSLGTVNLNKMIQESANPPQKGKSQLQVGERIFRVGDRVIHRRNNYDLGVFNGDIGVIQEIDNEELTCAVSFFPDQRIVEYKREDISELDLVIRHHNPQITGQRVWGGNYPGAHPAF